METKFYLIIQYLVRLVRCRSESFKEFPILAANIKSFSVREAYLSEFPALCTESFSCGGSQCIQRTSHFCIEVPIGHRIKWDRNTRWVHLFVAKRGVVNSFLHLAEVQSNSESQTVCLPFCYNWNLPLQIERRDPLAELSSSLATRQVLLLLLSSAL